MPRTLLVNYWYAHPVGHAVEGMRHALGYHAADSELSVSLLLNGATPLELARLCPFLDRVYGVPFTSFMEVASDPWTALVEVPREWDYVVGKSRAHHDRYPGFRTFYDAAEAHLRPRLGCAVVGQEPPAYLPHQDLRLELPERAREEAQATLSGRQAISIILAGSSGQRELYPSIASWELILTELAARYPRAALCLIGKLAADERTLSRVGRGEVERLLAAVPATVDCFDRPLLEQLALFEASDLLVSPHTGFAFAASTVGTPWLAISGGQWHEMFFNGVPVYSLLPNTERYPCFAWGGYLPLIEADSDGEGPRTPSMSQARIREDLPELLAAAELLVEKCLPYEQALADYFPRLLAAYGGDRSRVFSFDGIHRRYI